MATIIDEQPPFSTPAELREWLARLAVEMNIYATYTDYQLENVMGLNLLNIGFGLESGYEIWNALGERETMAIVAAGEDIWRGNQLTPAPTSTTTIPTPADVGEQMTVVSEAAADANGGAGVNTLRLHYIDAAGDRQTEDIIMAGVTPVDTVATDIRFINDMYSLSVGATGVSVGHIKIYKKGSTGLVYDMIEAGGNKSMVPHRMVPIGYNLLLTSWHCEESKNKRVAFRIRSTDMNDVLIPGVFCFKDTSYIADGEPGSLPLNISIPALSIVKISGWSDAAGAEGSASWKGVLRKL